MIKERFSLPLLSWYDSHGRKDLPWQHPRSPYRVWVSEIMLQQTQVKTVIPYFNRFMAKFPTIEELAKANEDSVFALWSGLGYYSRARNLHKTAKILSEIYKGEFPKELENLINLPGIGPSTAAAISSQAFNQADAILDGNVKRVLCRYFLVDGWPEQSSVKKRLWLLAKECMPKLRCADYTQAIMDLGATCCTTRKPDCTNCPLQSGCGAKAQNQANLYPQKKIKKALPLKQQQFLLLHKADSRIYLEKRPPTGIWGGLWCLPSIDINQCATTYIAENYALECLKTEELLSMRHSFSHFHLEINASSFATKPNGERINESQGKWFDALEIEDLGLAKPVSEIIRAFLKTIN